MKLLTELLRNVYSKVINNTIKENQNIIVKNTLLRDFDFFNSCLENINTYIEENKNKRKIYQMSKLNHIRPKIRRRKCKCNNKNTTKISDYYIFKTLNDIDKSIRRYNESNKYFNKYQKSLNYSNEKFSLDTRNLNNYLYKNNQTTISNNTDMMYSMSFKNANNCNKYTVSTIKNNEIDSCSSFIKISEEKQEKIQTNNNIKSYFRNKLINSKKVNEIKKNYKKYFKNNLISNKNTIEIFSDFNKSSKSKSKSRSKLDNIKPEATTIEFNKNISSKKNSGEN